MRQGGDSESDGDELAQNTDSCGCRWRPSATSASMPIELSGKMSCRDMDDVVVAREIGEPKNESISGVQFR